MAVYWGEKRYHSLDYYLKNTYGSKLYKLSLNGGMTCPNRDGTCGTRGCIFNWFFIIRVGAVCRKAQPFKNYCKYCRRRDHDGAGTCIYAYTVSADIEIGWYDGWSNYADDPGSGICQCNP